MTDCFNLDLGLKINSCS